MRNMFEDYCPRCDGEEFKWVECGYPEGEDFWEAAICDNCGLYYSSWIEKWLIDCVHWLAEPQSKEFTEEDT